MGQMIYDYTKSSIVKSTNNKDLFVKILKNASKELLPYEREKLINWTDISNLWNNRFYISTIVRMKILNNIK